MIFLFFFSCVGSLSTVCQPLDRIVIMQSEVWANRHPPSLVVDNGKHRRGLGHRSTGPMSLLDAISFHRRRDFAETTVAAEGNGHSRSYEA